MRSVDRREVGDSVNEVEELESARSRVKLGYSWKSEARSSRMSPSDLSWLQGCVFFLLGVAAAYGLNRCQNRRTNHGTSDVRLSTILVDNGITPTPFDDAQSSGSDPSSNHQQMHQIYYDDDRYGNDGYHRPRHSYNYPYAPQEIHNQEEEYPSHQISVHILLSRREFIDNRLINGLERHNLSCEVRGSVITVSGYPADDDPDGFLALVKQISGDRGASIVD